MKYEYNSHKELTVAYDGAQPRCFRRKCGKSVKAFDDRMQSLIQNLLHGTTKPRGGSI